MTPFPKEVISRVKDNLFLLVSVLSKLFLPLMGSYLVTLPFTTAGHLYSLLS